VAAARPLPPGLGLEGCDQVAAFDAYAAEGLACQARRRVAGIDAGLGDLILEDEVGSPVSIHVRDVAAARGGAVAPAGMAGISEADCARIDRGCVEAVGREDCESRSPPRH
jgi:hypothetical protein